VTAGILDSIDGALRDWEVSADAMRWLPEGERVAAPAVVPAAAIRPPVPVAVTMDAGELARALRDLGEMMARAFRPVFEGAVKLFHDLSAALFPVQHRRCWTCYPERKPKPLAVDGHEYQRRLAARRRRKR
jgi:hypothetical protein